MGKKKCIKIRREVGGVCGDELTGGFEFFDVNHSVWTKLSPSQKSRLTPIYNDTVYACIEKNKKENYENEHEFF